MSDDASFVRPYTQPSSLFASRHACRHRLTLGLTDGWSGLKSAMAAFEPSGGRLEGWTVARIGLRHVQTVHLSGLSADEAQALADVLRDQPGIATCQVEHLVQAGAI